MKFLKSFYQSVIFLSLVVTPVFYTGCSDTVSTVEPPPPPGGGIVTDVDENVYQVVQIGDQYWMAENLKTTRYNDGESIPNVTYDTVWNYLNTGAWVNYNNQISNDSVYGKLYNWYAVARGKLCPEGWRIPSDSDWTVLTNFLGGETGAGGKMKNTGTEYWNSPNTAATNSSGFSGLPGGGRTEDGTFSDVGSFGYWWSSTEFYKNDASWFRGLRYNYGGVNRIYIHKRNGLSCRCIMD